MNPNIKIVSIKRLNQNVPNTIMPRAFFMWLGGCKYLKPVLKHVEISSHIVHIYSALHLLPRVSDSFSNTFPDLSGFVV